MPLKVDTITKDYVKDAGIFADIFNYLEYVLYGVENQVAIHYAMPVKINLYEALEYAGQAEEAAKSHRKTMKKKKGKLFADEDRKMGWPVKFV